MTGIGLLSLIEFKKAGIGVIRQKCGLIILDEVAEQEYFRNYFHGSDLLTDGLLPASADCAGAKQAVSLNIG